MGSKILDMNMIAPMTDVYEMLKRNDGVDWMKSHLLENLSTSGAGDFADLDELAHYIYDAIQIAYSIREDDLDG